MKTLVEFLGTTAAMLSLVNLAACANQTAPNQTASTNSPQNLSSSATVSSTDSTPKASTAATKIDVSETEMLIKLSPATVKAGPVDFIIHNNGAVPHEFVVFKTKLELKNLPLKNGKLDEDSKSLQNVVDTGEQKLNSRESRTIHTNLTPGKYVAICNVGNHFSQGMKTTLTVQ